MIGWTSPHNMTNLRIVGSTRKGHKKSIKWYPIKGITFLNNALGHYCFHLFQAPKPLI